MKKDGWADYPFSFHVSDELGSAILAKISKKTGLQPKTCDLRRALGKARGSGKLGRATRDPFCAGHGCKEIAAAKYGRHRLRSLG